MNVVSDFDRGKKEGRTDALLAEHTARLDAINGSIEQSASAIEALTKTVRDWSAKLSDAIRTLQEEGRLAEERVNVAAATLAADAARRRIELEATATGLATTAATLAATQTTNDRQWSRGQQLAMLVIAFAAVFVTVYFSLPQ